MISFVHDLISMRASQHSAIPPLASSLEARPSPGPERRSRVAAAFAMSQVSGTRRKTTVLIAMGELEMEGKDRILYKGCH